MTGAFFASYLKRFGILGAGIGSQIFIGQLLAYTAAADHRRDLRTVMVAGLIATVAAIIPRVLSGPAEHPALAPASLLLSADPGQTVAATYDGVPGGDCGADHRRIERCHRPRRVCLGHYRIHVCRRRLCGRHGRSRSPASRRYSSRRSVGACLSAGRDARTASDLAGSSARHDHLCDGVTGAVRHCLRGVSPSRSS